MYSLPWQHRDSAILSHAVPTGAPSFSTSCWRRSVCHLRWKTTYTVVIRVLLLSCHALLSSLETIKNVCVIQSLSSINNWRAPGSREREQSIHHVAVTIRCPLLLLTDTAYRESSRRFMAPVLYFRHTYTNQEVLWPTFWPTGLLWWNKTSVCSV